MFSNRRAIGAVVVLGLTLAGLGGVAGAGSAEPELIVDGLVGPLGIDVTDDGEIIVGQAFAGVVSRVDANGSVTDLAVEPDSFTPGVTVDDHGRVLYTVSGEAGTLVKRIEHDGSTTVVADTGTFEATHNPDQGVQYAFEQITPECAAQWPEEFGPAQYSGVVDSNPYALATIGDMTFIAEAAGNAILSVGTSGQLRVVALLPTQPEVVTQSVIDDLGIPQCTLGLTYHFEPVPTDIEVLNGKLYVTLLPGGPEGPELGARGRVYRLNPTTGHLTPLGDGLLGATDLAILPSSATFVTELFAGQVTRAAPRVNIPLAQLPGAAAIEYRDGSLYIATAPPDGPGAIYRIRL